ncbi:MAG: transposase [Parasphingorhabdus sp.]
MSRDHVHMFVEIPPHVSVSDFVRRANTRKIESVWLAGRRYDRQGLNKLLSFTEAQAGNPANWVRLIWGFARSQVSGEL